MKKKLLLLFLLISLFSFQCTVNEWSGVIIIKNETNRPVKDIRIGNRTISLYIGPGNIQEYWFNQNFKGELSVIGARVHDNYKDRNFVIKVNRWYECKITKSDGTYYLSLRGSNKQGGDTNDDDYWDFSDLKE